MNRTPPVDSATSRERTGHRWTAIAILLVLSHFAIAWYLRVPGLEWGEDDAAYLLLAESLRNFSYRELQDVLAPLHARFPPVFPAMLALVGADGDRGLATGLVVVAACSAASLALLFDAVRRVLGVELAALTVALVAISPAQLQFGGTVMSEAPFQLFVMLALWALVREGEGWGWPWVAITGTILAALTRTAGVVFIPALWAYWRWKGEKRSAMRLLLASLPVAGWLVFTFLAPEADDRRLYIADLTAVGSSERNFFVARFLGTVRTTWHYLSSITPDVLAIPTVAGTPVDNAAWMVAFLVICAAGLLALARRWPAAAFFLIAYSILLVSWIYSFGRLLHPILPLLIVVLVLGVSQLARWRTPAWHGWLLAGLATLLGGGALRADLVLARRLKACDRTQPWESPSCWPEAHRSYLRLARWVRDSTPADAIFFVNKERAFYVHSGRRSINQDRGLREDSSTIGPYLRQHGVDFTVFTPIGVRSRRHSTLLVTACREFSIVRMFSPTTALLQVRTERALDESDSSCVTLRNMRAEVLSANTKTSNAR